MPRVLNNVEGLRPREVRIYMDSTAEGLQLFMIYTGIMLSIIYVRLLIKPTAEGRLFGCAH